MFALHDILPQYLRHPLRVLNPLRRFDTPGLQPPILVEIFAREFPRGEEGISVSGFLGSLTGSTWFWVVAGSLECDAGCAEEMAICGEDEEAVGVKFGFGEEAGCHCLVLGRGYRGSIV